LHSNQHQPLILLTEYNMHSIRARRNVSEGQILNDYPHERSEQSVDNSFDKAEKPERQTSRFRQCAGWIVLTAYTLLLVYKAVRLSQTGNTDNVPLWNLQDSQQLLAWMRDLVVMSFFEFAYFIPMGFITAIVIARGSGWYRWFPASLSMLLVASTLAVLVKCIETGWSFHLVAVVGLVIPVLGCFFGSWMGTTWLRGRRARIWFLPKVAVLVLLAAFCTGIILQQSVQERPLSFEAARVSSADKRRLAYLIRSKNPRTLIEGQTHILRLTEEDINVLLSWGLSLGSPNRKAKVSLECNSASIAASVGLITSDRKTRYLNLLVAGVPAIHEGTLSLHVNQLRLGTLEAPRWFLKLFSPIIISLLSHDRRSKPFLDATRAVAIDQDFIEVIYGPLNLSSQGFREDLFGQASTGREVLTATRAQVENLLTVVSQLPDTQPDFGKCFETVFSLARARSVEGDPVTENRAGIFAIGMLLGHPRVEEFLGPVHAGRDKYTARRSLSRVDLRGRSDWTKHFCVAAAIALLSDDVVSDAASLLKEELDADIAGSGFSFSDLLAARAGTTFALQATRDEAAARAMQERIVGGFQVEDFFPPAADLPEGIPDDQLQSSYGGVGGEGYNRLIKEIEQRISSCLAYRQLQ